jgi:hypothetical protein
MRPIAAVGQLPERVCHLAQQRGSGLELTNVLQGEFPYLVAGTVGVAPVCEQGADPLEREAECSGSSDECQPLNIVDRVVTVVVVTPFYAGKQSDVFVTSDRLHRHTGDF